MSIALSGLLLIDGWLIYKRVHYSNEIARLRASMSTFERQKTDAILASNENRMRIMIALIRRQAQIDKTLHLVVSIDSGLMTFEREGAVLRKFPIRVGPERRVGSAPDTVRMVVPRGTRTVVKVLDEKASWETPAWVFMDRGVRLPADRTLKGALGPAALILDGGTVIYSLPSVGPLTDSSYVMPGSIRATATDLKAIVPNLKAGMSVYFY